MLPFTTTLGQSIATVKDEYREGTFALFLNESGSSKLFGLTCRHVPFPDSNKAAYKWNETLPKIELVQPGTETLNERREDVEGALQAWNSPAANKFRDAAEIHQIQAKKNLEMIESLEEVSTRVVGHVVFSPAYELFESDWVEDFAVIELDKEKFKNGMKNVVIIDSIAWEQKHASKVDENFNFFRNNPPRFLPLLSAVPMTKLFDKKWKLDSDGDYFQVVGKRGKATRLTFGYINDVVSIQRLGRDDYSQELCILSFKYTPFSGKGDSGSAVFDVQGNVYGMITSGHTGLTARTDITYVTPLDRILARIEKDEGRRFELP
ncbi:MAG: hypothetical protein Q9227_007002 [Pyrenula ochraceoflavens]